MKLYWLFFIVIILSCFSCKDNNDMGKASTTNALQNIEQTFEQILANNNASTDSLQYIVENAVNDSLKIEAYNKLFFRKVYSDTAAAKKYYEALFTIGKKNPYSLVRAYNLKGVYTDVQGNYDSAFENYQKAIELSENKYPNVEGSAHNNIGLIYWNRGNYSDALMQYNKALELFEKTENEKLQANVLSNIGLIYMDINNPEKSDNHFRRALEIRKALNDEYGISVSLSNLAKSYSDQKKYKEAIVLYDSATSIKIKLGDEIGLSNALYNQSTCYNHLDNYSKAIELLEKAEKLCIKNGSEANNLTNIYTAFGEVYLKTKQSERLAAVLEKMKHQVDKHKDERNLRNYYYFLSKYYELKNNYKNALLYTKVADSIFYKLEGVEVKNAINLYEIQYQTAKKEKELTDAQLKIAENEISTKQKNIWLILLGSAILIGLGIFRNFNIKSNAKQKQLALENELLKEQTYSKMQEQRLEISRDLHDSLGAQLTFINSILDGLKNSSAKLDEVVNSKINTLSDFSENSITELKNTLWVLNSKEINLDDLKKKILNFIKNASEAKEDVKFNFNFDVSENFDLNSKQAVNLFRAVQEIVNNALKYADASEIKIDVQQNDNTLAIKITDNGKGFDYEKEKNKSFGLTNIQNRILEVEGNLNIETSVGKGTKYEIDIKL